jgi:hypothetical protein
MNLRGLSDLSPAHYSAVCELGKGVVDMMLDTGGARTMIDLETAMKLGLPVERVSATKYFGSFYSASGVPTPYAGRVKGPVTIRFSKNVVFTMRELKVINYPESLLLVGTDLLGGNPGDGYTFAYVGVNPISKMGEIVFAAPGGASLEACELVLWPTATSVLKATSPPPRVSFAEPLIQPDPLADSDRDPDALEDDARRFLALVRNQG